MLESGFFDVGNGFNHNIGTEVADMVVGKQHHINIKRLAEVQTLRRTFQIGTAFVDRRISGSQGRFPLHDLQIGRSNERFHSGNQRFAVVDRLFLRFRKFRTDISGQNRGKSFSDRFTKFHHLVLKHGIPLFKLIYRGKSRLFIQ